MIAEDRWFISTSGEMEVELEEMLRTVTLLRSSSTGVLLVARQDRRVVGFLSLRPPPWRRTRHVVKLEIMVDRESRGLGVGRALLEAGIAWAEQAEDVTKIGLAVFADNERAVALYEAHGFGVEGRRVREYREEDGTYRDDVLLYRFV